MQINKQPAAMPDHSHNKREKSPAPRLQ